MENNLYYFQKHETVFFVRLHRQCKGLRQRFKLEMVEEDLRCSFVNYVRH